MAGHPLRPATRRRHGEPLPHHQADRPRVHPEPINLSTHTPCGGRSYPVLDAVSSAYPRVQGRLLTCYSPVRHSSTPSKLGASAFDLHVLSTPPAFVLSQDQTLRKKLHAHKNSGQFKCTLLSSQEPDTHRTDPTTTARPSEGQLVYCITFEVILAHEFEPNRSAARLRCADKR